MSDDPIKVGDDVIVDSGAWGGAWRGAFGRVETRNGELLDVKLENGVVLRVAREDVTPALSVKRSLEELACDARELADRAQLLAARC